MPPFGVCWIVGILGLLRKGSVGLLFGSLVVFFSILAQGLKGKPQRPLLSPRYMHTLTHDQVCMYTCMCMYVCMSASLYRL